MGKSSRGFPAPKEIINEVAYANAIHSRIRNNRRVTGQRKMSALIDALEVTHRNLFKDWLTNGYVALDENVSFVIETLMGEAPLGNVPELEKEMADKIRAYYSNTQLSEYINTIADYQLVSDHESRLSEEDYKRLNDERLRIHRTREKVARMFGHPPRFLTDAIMEWGGLTQKQLDFAVRMWNEKLEGVLKRLEEDKARKDNATPWVIGRNRGLTGTILKVSEDTRPGFGYYQSEQTVYRATIKMGDGRILWFTLPSNVGPDCDQTFTDWSRSVIGSTMQIGAITVDGVSDTDRSFAFGKRPHKVEIVTKGSSE